MLKFKISIIINQSPDIVTKAFLNPGNITFYTKDLEKFEVVREIPGQVGSVARLHYLQNGRRYVMEDKLLAVNPGKQYVSEVSGDALVAQVETTFTPLGSGTEMAVSWAGKPKLFLLKLLFPFLRGKMVRQAIAELGMFKKLVETKGVNFS